MDVCGSPHLQGNLGGVVACICLIILPRFDSNATTCKPSKPHVLSFVKGLGIYDCQYGFCKVIGEINNKRITNISTTTDTCLALSGEYMGCWTQSLSFYSMRKLRCIYVSDTKFGHWKTQQTTSRCYFLRLTVVIVAQYGDQGMKTHLTMYCAVCPAGNFSTYIYIFFRVLCHCFSFSWWKLIKKSSKLPNIDCISWTVFKSILFNKHEMDGELDFPSMPLRNAR